MTSWDMEELSGTGQWLLVELFCRFPDKAHENELGIQMIVGGIELKDINPAIQIMADALDRHIRVEANELAQEKIREIQDILDCAVAELVGAIEYKAGVLRGDNE